MIFAIKTEIDIPDASAFEFMAEKTMYGGKLIGEGDTLLSLPVKTRRRFQESPGSHDRRPA